ncbi:aspartate carbamoyltransferase [Klebsiella pneumoniae]|uniref:Aspartate carbamoyltransferase n=1 Tax=Klebsiella pneumoniae TaxID=573 RepID=A0A378B7J5_KLEPN|nr:aspartate carbamoyltransferase [Klebsiella pneumoniae]
MANPLYQKHIISINDLSREDLELVLATAAKLKANPQPELLKHKVIASCFFEASTRTRLSFETSMHRLGASVVGFSDSANTSLGKKRGNAGGYHLRHQHLRRRHRDASSAGGRRAPGDRILRRRAGTERRRRR